MKIKADKELSLIDSPADITGVIVVGDQMKLPNRQLKRLFELRGERHRARSNALKRLLDGQIAGRVAQGHVHLQETLCDDVAKIMLAHPRVKAVRVSTMKPDVYPDCEGVGVEVFQIKA